MNYTVRKEATEASFGRITTDKRTYRPLDTVRVFIQGREEGDTKCTVKVLDAKLKPYFDKEVALKNNKGTVDFIAGGNLGSQVILLYFPDSAAYKRRTFFLLECNTAVETGNQGYDTLYPLTREALLLNRREFDLKNGPLVGYISADTVVTDGIWLRDWIYHLPAYVNWERELTCGLERFFATQGKDGSIPDGIRRNGDTWRMGVESDVEYILVMAVWGTWRVTGDNSWLRKAIPYLEKALAYIRNDKMRWDEEHNLVTRGHTCDTWDFEIGTTCDFVGNRRVIATCDQTGYYLAFVAMAEMYQSIGESGKSKQYREMAREFRRRAHKLLWDGEKYLHHVHITPMEHPGFDERNQLALANVWAMTRGLADHQKAVSIIKQYQRRYKETGDVYPWWSLQPGYPDELGYYPQPYCQQGGYANGGLLPFVGGELSRAAFEHGRESYGLELLDQYLEHLRKTNNEVYVWYWPNGEPGIRTTNEVPHNGWGMTEWLMALLEGLGGIKDRSGQMKKVNLSPRWAVTPMNKAYAAVRYASNNCYFAYRMGIDRSEKKIHLNYTGSGNSVRFHILLPDGWKLYSVEENGELIKSREEKIEESFYVNFTRPLSRIGTIIILGQKSSDGEEKDEESDQAHSM